jgi:hypothetical protein
MTAGPGYDTRRLQALQAELEQLNWSAYRAGLAAASDDSATPPPVEAETHPIAPQPKGRKSKRAAATAAPELDQDPARPLGPKAERARAKRAKAKETEAAPEAADQTEAEAEREAKRAARAAKRAAIPPQDKGKEGAQRLLAMLTRQEDDQSPGVPGTSFTEAGVVRLMAHLRTPRSRRFRYRRRLLTYLTRPVAMGVRTAAGISVERLQMVHRQLVQLQAMGWDRFQATRAAKRARRAPLLLDPSTMAVVPLEDPSLAPGEAVAGAGGAS